MDTATTPPRPVYTAVELTAYEQPDWEDFDMPICRCGHAEDWHRGGTGSCEYIAQQFGPLGLHCECMAFQNDSTAEAL